MRRRTLPPIEKGRIALADDAAVNKDSYGPFISASFIALLFFRQEMQLSSFGTGIGIAFFIIGHGLPSHGCPLWQPSCAFRWSAPDGPKRLSGQPYAYGRWPCTFLRPATGHLRTAFILFLTDVLLEQFALFFDDGFQFGDFLGHGGPGGRDAAALSNLEA